MKRIFLAMLLCGPVPAAAQTIAVDTVGAASGTYYLAVTIEDGQATVRQLDAVRLEAGTPTTPGPIDPGDPDGPLTELAAKARQWAGAVTGDPNRDETAAILGALYLEIANQLRLGKFKDGPAAMSGLRLGSNLLLAQRGAAAAWQPFRDQVSAELTRHHQAGDLNYADALEQIGGGLVSFSGDSAAAIDLAKIIELVRMILALLEILGGVLPS